MSKGFWKDYFSFTKRERTAVFILVFIIVFFIFLPGFFVPKFKKPFVDAALQRQLDSITASAGIDSLSSYSFAAEKSDPDKIVVRPVLHPFNFDPNALSAEAFKRMGLKDKTIQTILNYRARGGVFRRPEDIRKIYGLTKEEADQLIPFVVFENSEDQATKNEDTIVKPSHQYLKQYKKIEINTATASEWKALPGIGEVLSNRIVKFRTAIHGFKSIEDVRKTYGLSDSAYQLILPYLTINESSETNN